MMTQPEYVGSELKSVRRASASKADAQRLFDSRRVVSRGNHAAIPVEAKRKREGHVSSFVSESPGSVAHAQLTVGHLAW